MSKKLTIRELAIYYVKKYNLEVDCEADNHGSYGTTLGTYIMQITRLLKKTKVGEKTLWESIKATDSARRISIEEFERYCLEAWTDYISKHCKDNKKPLNNDREKYQSQRDVQYWKDRAEKFETAYNNLLAAQKKATDEIEYTPKEELERKKESIYREMVKIVCDSIFEPFEDRLIEDLQSSHMSICQNPECEPDVIEARERLNDPGNYIRTKKLFEAIMQDDIHH